MLIFAQILLILLVIGGLAYWRVAMWQWTAAIAVLLLSLACFGSLSWWFLGPFWVIFLGIAIVFNTPHLRRLLIVQPAYALIKKVLPPMSRTEREALEAGDVWWEGDLFSGRPYWRKLLKLPKPALTAEESAFLDNQVETLCSMLNDWKITHEYCDLPPKVWEYLKKERFFAMVLPKEYGGLGFSAMAHSCIVAKIGTRSTSAAVTAMVPNSLGPGELLIHYGTQQQKDYYLPRLARGEEIPCFGLTSLDAGSDAASMIDTGIVCKGQYQGKEVLGIRLNWSKRYITLAPIATLLGLAFKLYDPDHLLGDKEEIGITICLIPTDQPGIEIGNRHFPLNAAFLNGPTRGKDVFAPLDWVIGGQKMVGNGWRMLMECLSLGRGISLPALSTATGMMAFRITGAYSRIRRQFKVPIGRFEGVEAPLANIGGFMYLLESTRLLSLQAVDLKIRPAIASAITKCYMTEIARKVGDHAMDIHGGFGIQLGPHNYIGRPHQFAPISITVEGANILTRNLIVFGQGAVRCHPYIYREIQAVGKDETLAIGELDQLLMGHVGYTISNFVRTLALSLTAAKIALPPVKGQIRHFYQQFSRMSAAFAFVADIAMMLLGGDLKRKESLSARLGDILSYLYMGSAAFKYYQDNGQNAEDWLYVEWASQTCLHHIQTAFDEFFVNFPIKPIGMLLRFLIFPYGKAYKKPMDKNLHQIAANMQEPSELRDRLTYLCYFQLDSEDPAGRVELAFQKRMIVDGIVKKLQAAQRDKQLQKKLSLVESAEAGVTKGIITAEELDQIRDYDKARINALLVDEFSPGYLSKGMSYD